MILIFIDCLFEGKEMVEYMTLKEFNAAIIDIADVIFHGKEYEWTSEITRAAALYGYPQVLKCAHEHGCPLHKDITLDAATNNNLYCLEYIYEKCGDEVKWESTVD